MPREELWLALTRALQSLTASTRPLRICLDSYFPTEEAFDALPDLFPYVERIGLIVPSQDAAAIYRQMFRDSGWNKVVPVVLGWDSTDSYDLIVTRWW